MDIYAGDTKAVACLEGATATLTWEIDPAFLNWTLRPQYNDSPCRGSAGSRPLVTVELVGTSTSTAAQTSVRGALSARLTGEARVGSDLSASDASAPLAKGVTATWVKCTDQSASTCTTLATGSKLRVPAAAYGSWLQFVLTRGAARSASPPVFVSGACLVGLTSDAPSYSYTRTAEIAIPPKPNYGCVRVNLWIQTDMVNAAIFPAGWGDDRGPSPTANLDGSRAVVFLDFERGVAVIAGKSSESFIPSVSVSATQGITEPPVVHVSGPSFTTFDPYQIVAGFNLQLGRDFGPTPVSPNAVNITSGGPNEIARFRYHFTTGANASSLPDAPSIDGVIGIRKAGKGPSVCATRDHYPSLEIYQDAPGRAGRAPFTQQLAAVSEGKIDRLGGDWNDEMIGDGCPPFALVDYSKQFTPDWLVPWWYKR